MAKSVKKLIAEAVKAGKKRDYKKAILILEDLAAKGLAETKAPFGSGEKGNPEIYLYLARAQSAIKNYSRAVVYGAAYTKRCPKDYAGFFFLGRAYLGAERFERAAHYLKKSLALNPNRAETLAMLGLSYLKGKKARLARTVFEKALYLKPDDTRLKSGYINALFIEAVYELKKGNFGLARQMFTFVIKNNADGVAPRMYLAQALKMQGFLQQALTQYAAAAEFAPDDKTLQLYPAMIKLELGDVTGAVQDMEALGITIPENGITGRFIAVHAVKKHLKEGDFTKAAYAARVYIRTFGSDAEIRFLAGEAMRAAGSTKAALNHYKCALKHNPENPYPHYGIMLLFQETFQWKELKKAVLHAEKVSACAPEDLHYYKTIAEAHTAKRLRKTLIALQTLIRGGKIDTVLFNALGTVYIKLHLPDLALNWYKKSLALNPDDEEAVIGHIACCEALSLNGKARTLYTRYLSKWKNNIHIRKDFVLFLERLEKWEDAANQLEILMGQSKKMNCTAELALLRRKAGQYGPAAILYWKMLKAKPKERTLLHNLIFCLDKMAQTKTALELLQAYRNFAGINHETFLIEGILLMRLKKKSDAVRIFRYVLEKEPSNVHAAELLQKAQSF